MSTDLAPLVDVLGWTLVHFVWQGIVAAAALRLALLLVPGGWARVRYLLAAVALAAMALMPVATAWQLTDHSTSGRWSDSRFGSVDASDIRTGLANAPARTAADETGPTGSGPAPFRAAPRDWLPWLVALWICGVSICTVRLAGGWWQTRRLLTTDVLEPDPEWSAAITRLAARLRITRPVRVLESARVQVPMVIGWLTPVLLLPAAALSGLSPRQIEAVLAHELAHIRRHDYAINLLQAVVETVLFYHPAVWWVSHVIRVEREHCCDDLAVAACGDVLLYARALTALEAMRQSQARLAMAAHGGSLLARVHRLLGARGPRPMAASGWVVASVTALMVAAAGGSGWIDGLARLAPAASSANAHASASVVPEPVQAPAPAAEPRTDPTEQPAADPSRAPQPGTSDHWDFDAVFEAAFAAADAAVRAAIQQAHQEIERAARDAARLHARGASRAGERAIRERARELGESAATIATEARRLGERHRVTIARRFGPAERARVEAVRQRADTLARRARELARRSLSQSPAPPPPPAPPAVAAPPASVPKVPAVPLTTPPEPPPPVHAVPAVPAPAPPALSAPPAPPAPPPGGPSTTSERSTSFTMTRRENGRTLAVRGQGQVVFTADNSDVQRLEPGGYFRLESGGGWFPWAHTSTFEARADATGVVTRTYTVDGKPVDAAEGRRRFASVLPDIARALRIE